MFACAQRGQGLAVARVAGKMEASQPLDGNDAAFSQNAYGRVDDGVGRLEVYAERCDAAFFRGTVFSERGLFGLDALEVFLCIGAVVDRAPDEMGAALKSGVGLGLEAAVFGVGVFGRA